MTGSRSVAYLHEPDGNYMGSPNDTTYKVPGKDITIEDISLENAIQRMRLPDDPQTYDAIAQTFEGAISMSWTETTPWWLNHVFGGPPASSGTGPYTYTWTFPGAGSAWYIQSSRWFVGINHANGVAERELKGAVFGQLQSSISIGETVRTSVTGFYGDEQKNTALTPGSYQGKNATPMVFHGGELEIPNATTITRPQEATLEITTGARPEREWARKPVGAVLGAVETTLDLQKVITGTSQIDLAYGTTTAPTTGDVGGAADGTLRFTTGGTPQLEYQMTRVTPDTYNWQNAANIDADFLEDESLVVNEIVAEATSSESSAL